MNVTVDLVNASGDESVPASEDFQHWSAAAVSRLRPGRACELSIRVVDEDESARLNGTWRRRNGPTNVLSFPASTPLPDEVFLLGDLAICAQVVRREAAEQHKAPLAHWAHMTIHGILHLGGYDHEAQADAERMESLETAILGELGFADPYKST